MVFLRPRIYPLINISNFPFRFHIKDSWINPFIERLADYRHDIELDINDWFFHDIDYSEYTKEFLQSESYKNAEKLFDLTEAKKKFEELINSSAYVKIEDYVENANLLSYFPFESNIVNDADCWIEGGLFTCNIEIKKSSDKCLTIPILGDLLCPKFYIETKDLKLIILNNLFKIGLPNILENYISKLLSSYKDLEYKYITLININPVFNYPTVILEILGRFVNRFSHTTALMEQYKFRFFIYSSYHVPIFIVDNNMMIRCSSIRRTPYIIIHSDEHPLENKILQDFEKESRYFVDKWTVLEIERV
jgi:hypothetical protein